MASETDVPVGNGSLFLSLRPEFTDKDLHLYSERYTCGKETFIVEDQRS